MNLLKAIFRDKDAFPSKKILVIDDSPVDSVLPHRILEKRGYDVRTVHSGRDGRTQAEAFQPDVILMDFNMPDMKGSEVCRLLKENPKTAHIPVIFITSEDTPQTVIETFENGAEVFLTKPINAHELLMQVRLTLNDKNYSPQE